MRTILFVTLLATAFCAVLKPENVKKIDLQTPEVAAAQVAIADWMREIFGQRAEHFQMHYLILVDILNKASVIRKKLVQLDVSNETISDIVSEGFIHFNVFQSASYSYLNGLDMLVPIMITATDKLSALDETLIETWKLLVEYYKLNNDEFDVVQSAVNTMMIEMEKIILEAMVGLSGETVVEIRLKMNEIKGMINTRQDQMNMVYRGYAWTASQALDAIKIVADELLGQSDCFVLN
ncbi:uncharacterized protein LOC132201740 [Neocloeon triangulifer]|uniref:uncharacterized protein LOC132201740 n=1 Tax=Neocloeon triangulifer TaxID=2078957 RepID=UPI00286F01B3|nr:uncharacterized protein LOC132201740 [Neocloeon triangulifer]XP_059484172.1 uncharacterized protein LOC132201740 [Neocloeon triangulifer]